MFIIGKNADIARKQPVGIQVNILASKAGDGMYHMASVTLVSLALIYGADPSTSTEEGTLIEAPTDHGADTDDDPDLVDLPDLIQPTDSESTFSRQCDSLTITSRGRER